MYFCSVPYKQGPRAMTDREEDLQLVQQILEKNSQNACTRLVNKYRASLFQFMADKIRSGTETEDLMQEVFAKVFRNLASNAVAYSSGRDIFIRLVAEDDEKYTISFADNGIGVEEEHLPRLFERFYRVDKARSRESGGTGLGLSIVRHIAIIHKGTIKAESRLGEGSEFTLSIPLR